MKSTNPKRPLRVFHTSLARWLTMAQMRPTGLSPSKAMKHWASQNSNAGFFFGSSVVSSSMYSGGTAYGESRYRSIRNLTNCRICLLPDSGRTVIAIWKPTAMPDYRAAIVTPARPPVQSGVAVSTSHGGRRCSCVYSSSGGLGPRMLRARSCASLVGM